MEYNNINENQHFYELAFTTATGELVKLLVSKEEDTIQIVRERDGMVEPLQISESSLEVIIR